MYVHVPQSVCLLESANTDTKYNKICNAEDKYPQLYVGIVEPRECDQYSWELLINKHKGAEHSDSNTKNTNNIEFIHLQ